MQFEMYKLIRSVLSLVVFNVLHILFGKAFPYLLLFFHINLVSFLIFPFTWIHSQCVCYNYNSKQEGFIALSVFAQNLVSLHFLVSKEKINIWASFEHFHVHGWTWKTHDDFELIYCQDVWVSEELIVMTYLWTLRGKISVPGIQVILIVVGE